MNTELWKKTSLFTLMPLALLLAGCVTGGGAAGANTVTESDRSRPVSVRDEPRERLPPEHAAAGDADEEYLPQEDAAGNIDIEIEREQPSPESERRLKAAGIAASLDIKTLAAQLILSAVDGKDAVSERTRRLLAEVPVGGVLLFGHNVSADTEKSRAFIAGLSRHIAALSLVPFIASDQEGGTVQRFKGTAALPEPLSYWEKLSKNAAGKEPSADLSASFSAIEKDAAGAARELRRLGITLNLAPVVEVLTAENRVFLKGRSYGPDTAFTAGASAAFIRGMESAGIAATLKHFPGHSSADPHHNRSVLAAPPGELEKMTASFAEVIRRESPAMVMMSHTIIPAWDTKPSSLSPAAVKRLRDLGFSGVIITDDLAMAGAGAPLEISAIEALAAGADMIITWPADLGKVHRAIVSAVETGKLDENRLREAAARIIYQKIRYGLL